VARVSRQVFALCLNLPHTAIGRVCPGAITFIDYGPSDTGWQLSLTGLAGIAVARDEDLVLNVLRLGFGIDIDERVL
jgi:hypothetical protein